MCRGPTLGYLVRRLPGFQRWPYPKVPPRKASAASWGEKRTVVLETPPLALRSGPRCPGSPRLQEFRNALCELLSSTAPLPRFLGLRPLRPVVTLPLHFPPGPLTVPRSLFPPPVCALPPPSSSAWCLHNTCLLKYLCRYCFFSSLSEHQRVAQKACKAAKDSVFEPLLRVRGCSSFT